MANLQPPKRWYVQNSQPGLFARLLESFYLWQFRRQHVKKKAQQWTAPVPVIVVGNITLGGTGKTPLVIWLVEYLTQAGYRPGVVSRGYKAKPPHFPWSVKATDSAECAGDEPLMITRRTGCPLVIAPDRCHGVKVLIEQHGCDLIISDDGLQHVQLGRDIELVVVDGARGLGNGHCLPAGPLREPADRLESVDFVISNGKLQDSRITSECQMQLQPVEFCTFDGRSLPLDSFCDEQVDAVAGIGNPQRFFNSLSALGCQVVPHEFCDHHKYQLSQLQFNTDFTLLTTEKDAVKLAQFTLPNAAWLKVEAKLPDTFETTLLARLADIEQSKVA